MATCRSGACHGVRTYGFAVPIGLVFAALAALPRAAGGHGFKERSIVPPGGLDGYTRGLGLQDVSSDEFYHDADSRPHSRKGMPVEMKKMIVNADNFHRKTLVNSDAQHKQDERDREKELRLPEQRIPRKIWQVCSQAPIPKVLRSYSETWSNENEEYLHTLCSEEEARSLVEDFYPELLTVYDGLKDHSRLDLFMYMILFKFGGIFASIDSTCELPLRKLIRADDDMLVGHQPILTSRVLQKKVGVQHHTWPFHQWVLASAPGHPVLRFLIEYIAKNSDKPFASDHEEVDCLLRSGAAPFNDAIMAFKKAPVAGNNMRIAPIGTFALGQVWGRGDAITKPCAKERHGYGWWYDEAGNRHMCDCANRKDRSRKNSSRGDFHLCFVRRRHIEGAGVKSLVRYAERDRRRWSKLPVRQ